MLRYDAAWPTHSEDIHFILTPPEKFARYRVRLRSMLNRFPTTARWNSFGWRVIEINGKAVIQ